MPSSILTFMALPGSAALLSLCLLLGGCHHHAGYGGSYSWSDGGHAPGLSYRHRPVYSVNNNSASASSPVVVVQNRPGTPSRQGPHQAAPSKEAGKPAPGHFAGKPENMPGRNAQQPGGRPDGKTGSGILQKDNNRPRNMHQADKRPDNPDGNTQAGNHPGGSLQQGDTRRENIPGTSRQANGNRGNTASGQGKDRTRGQRAL